MAASSCSVVSAAGASVKSRLVKLSLVSAGALIAVSAFAQSASPSGRADTPKAKAAPRNSKTVTAAADVKGKAPAAATTVVAAGSVIVLADGIVANARIAPVEPPANGFVYER